MTAIAIALIPALIVGIAILARSVSVTCLAAVFVVATACLPAEFFAIQGAGLTWTIDRFILLGVIGAAALAWKRQQLNVQPLHPVDLLVGMFAFWLTARTLTQPLGSVIPSQPHTLMHMINGYAIPFVLYFVVRSTPVSARSLKPVFWILLLTTIYLAFTAIFEVSKTWNFVFPKFIGDPTLGIHFGRARGPMLQSVRLGICLIAGLATLLVFGIWHKPTSKAGWCLAAGLTPIILMAIFLTYTRSIWLGLLVVVAILVVLCLKGRLRNAIIVGGALAGILGGLILGPNLIAFKREYSAAETRESTYMRAAFAYVSLQMIQQRPIAGFGFNQFNVANLEFLNDRSTDIRVSSIRGYVHHNSYLSLMVDLGLIGFFLYMLILIGFVKEAWHLWKDLTLPNWARGLGLLALCVTSVHLLQMAFHEVSFSTIENSLLFCSYGLVMAVRRRAVLDSSLHHPRPTTNTQCLP
jgi:O-antigen ligase